MCKNKTHLTTYDGKNHQLRNIIAEFSPEKNNRILLCAHWDTRHVADHDTERTNEPILGANDGGSGVGVLLELARQLAIKTVILVLISSYLMLKIMDNHKAH